MKVKILFVDDEKEIRDHLMKHFQDIGFEVLSAANGREALEILEEMKVEIVVTDINMPMMDGVTLLRIIKKSYPLVHTIILTDNISIANVLNCMRYGADTCTFKPLVNFDELEKAINLAVDNLQNWLNILQVVSDRKKQ